MAKNRARPTHWARREGDQFRIGLVGWRTMKERILPDRPAALRFTQLMAKAGFNLLLYGRVK